jgi:hypothetical protein
LKSALSQFLNNNSAQDVIICQREQIINNTNAVSTCQYNNYIIAQYGLETTYEKFQNDYRNDVRYLIYENKIVKITDSFTIQANNSIEIHFDLPAENLNNLFSAEHDNNTENIISVNFSYLIHYY